MLPPRQGPRQGSAVDELEFSAKWYPASQPTAGDAATVGKVRDVLGRDIALHRGTGRKNQLANPALVELFLKLDKENQTAWLELGNGGYWWYWS